MKKLILVSIIMMLTAEAYCQDVSNRVRRITRQSYARVPIGSIVAFAGTETSFNELNQRLLDESFMVCNGQELDRRSYPVLHYVIRTVWGGGSTGSKFSIPNLQGQFLRGADPDGQLDPDITERKNNDGEDRMGVGGYQGHSTAFPSKTPFEIKNNGNHQHAMGNGSTDKDSGSQYEKSRFADWTQDAGRIGRPKLSTDKDGAHDHIVTGGGDKETRPVNAAVLYIIRVK